MIILQAIAVGILSFIGGMLFRHYVLTDGPVTIRAPARELDAETHRSGDFHAIPPCELSVREDMSHAFGRWRMRNLGEVLRLDGDGPVTGRRIEYYRECAYCDFIQIRWQRYSLIDRD